MDKHMMLLGAKVLKGFQWYFYNTKASMKLFKSKKGCRFELKDYVPNHERVKNKINGFGMTEERLLEIMNNIQDHWGSPPILTAETLEFILSNQWVTTENVATEETVLENKLVQKMKETRIINSLVKELCQTIERIDTENKHEITKEIMNDSVLQEIRNGESGVVADENTLEHLIQLLQHHNNKS
ncbi:hypothetical protein K501DRAFT_273996 [Backusella circina FSU 941]|nr:hypothetical protein K501DRAFT_273996 [Backusella circina FSU 941]